jgi:ribosomal protein S6E (S10)
LAPAWSSDSFLIGQVEGRVMPQGTRMEDDLTRAQHYRVLAVQMHESAATERNGERRKELLELAAQYERLADKLIGKHQ